MREILGAFWACAGVWYGLVWAFRSENKRVKSIVSGVMVVCYLVLGFFGLAFLVWGLRNLYRHEFPFFVVAVACLSLAITEFFATFEAKQSERDWAKQKTRQFEYDIRQLREEKERLREENEDLRGLQRADYSGEHAGNFDCLVTEHVRREMEKLE